MNTQLEYLKEHGWPGWVNALFPLTIIYYRPTRPRPRKRLVGYETTVISPATPGHPRKIRWKPRYKNFKKYSTRDQNNYSYATCCLLYPDGYGTMRRSLKHKGFSKVIAMVYSTDEEINRSRRCDRYIFSKYKSLWEIYRRREVYTADMHDLFVRLEAEYPTLSTGQLRLW